jgi:hypothetical protein
MNWVRRNPGFNNINIDGASGARENARRYRSYRRKIVAMANGSRCAKPVDRPQMLGSLECRSQRLPLGQVAFEHLTVTFMMVGSICVVARMRVPFAPSRYQDENFVLLGSADD